MNEATHTPGPWTASRYGAVRYDVTGGGRSVAIVGRCQQARLDHLNIARSTIAARGEAGHLAEQEAQALESLQPQVEADARLIAAAPDLLAALKEALDVMPFGLTNRIEWMVAAKDAEIAELKEQHAQEIERIKKNHGCARQQGTTQFCREALDAHKEADAMRADAALGAAVRRMPEGAMLWHSEDTWYLHPQDTPAAPMGQGDTPEAAMIAAGLMKGEK